MERFKTTLGDWTRDGHGKTDVFILITDRTADDVHKCFLSLQARGLDISDLCCEYRDYFIPLEWFKKHNIDPVELFNADISQLCSFEDDTQITMNPVMFLKLFLFVLNREDPSLKIRLDESIREFVKFEGVYGMGDGLYD